jgi:hypothetical protein
VERRYLVIFKDTALHSLRHLHAGHVALLEEVEGAVRAFLAGAHPQRHRAFQCYFHYMPSVFQLHMHVCIAKATDAGRVHALGLVRRNLRARHVGMLRGLLAFIREWLREQEPLLHAKYHMYFHYMPSVFQLHMHVSMRKAPDSLRAQDVQHVIRNLELSGTWYRDALILCSGGALAKSRPSDLTKLE